MRRFHLAVRVLLAAALLLPLALAPLHAGGPPPHEAVAGATIISPIDGATMVFVPDGKFFRGSLDDVRVTAESPQSEVHLDAYYIDRTEVTVAQYRKFCVATKRATPASPNWGWLGHDNHPIVNVSWNDATAYATWAGKALPTEAQWEKAARGWDGRAYPWGNEWDAAKAQCSKAKWGDAKKTAPVGSFPAGASPYGALDMAGNVWEWCADWYSADYYKDGQVKNPTGPETGTSRVLRGGSWNDNNHYYFRTACRDYNSPGGCYGVIGFRCVSPPPGG
jgi:formylglycine-generating enzyme required for sulfatase activity